LFASIKFGIICFSLLQLIVDIRIGRFAVATKILTLTFLETEKSIYCCLIVVDKATVNMFILSAYR